MKRLVLSVALFIFLLSSGNAQMYFFDDFESYTAGSLLGPQSSSWRTWSSSTGGNSEDVDVSNASAYSGNQSLYFYSSGGNGPNDVVLDFGGVHNSGIFKYRAMYYIPSGGYSYFNFQGGSTTGQQWSYDFYFYNGGTWSSSGGSSANGTFPHDQWFELLIDINFDTDIWKVYIDGNLQATINNTNPVSFLDMYEVYSGSEWYVDDVSFCTNQGCNPELALSSASLSPTTVCTYHGADLSVNVKNNSNFSADSFMLGVDVGNSQLSQLVYLNGLAPGKDTTLTLQGFFKSPIAGNAIPVAAINLSGDHDASNDTSKTSINVLQSPQNTMILAGTPYQSAMPNTPGTMQSPDITTAGQVLTYEIQAPTGFSNSNYGTAWNISGVTLFGPSGATLSSSYYSFNAPSGGNATLSFSPDSILIDSVVMYSFAVNDLVNGCDSVLSRYIHVVPRPHASFSQMNVCDKQDMNFADNSNIKSGSMTYMWDFGDSSTSDLQNPGHKYSTYGTYTVKLVVTSDFGYKDSTDLQVEVYQLPTADFGVVNACEGSDVTFSDKSFIPTGTPGYSWDFGDGSPQGTGASIGHMYTTTGNYTVRMTVTVNGCSDSKNKYATQAPRVVPDFSSQVSCNNTTASFSNSSTLKFGTFGSTWKFGDGTEATANNVDHPFTGFGNFDVTLVTTTDLGCVDSITHTVTLIEAPHANFMLNNACSNEELTINNTTNVPSSGTNSYNWDLGNGMHSNDQNPTVTYPGPGSYVVHLLVFNTNGCVDSTEHIVMIDTKPIADIIAKEVCEGSESQFVNNSVNVDASTIYSWDFGNGVNSMATDTSFTYSAAGNYSVVLIATTMHGCMDTATLNYNVNAIPDGGFTFTSGQKGDGTMVFTANESGQSYEWFMGDGNKYQGDQVIHTYALQGNYLVQLHVKSPAGCMSQSDQLVSVTPTGLSAIDGKSVNVYPNPSNGNFTLQVGENVNIQSVEVLNSLGQQVEHTTTIASGKAQVSVPSFDTGVYLVRVNTSNGTLVSRVHLR
ncbi:MAG: PKD domain-containing protein [Bacteroidetes bacterium]|nr:PKD domain-containing protein [Bacteroidota bacterium]